MKWGVERQSDGAHLIVVTLKPGQALVVAWAVGAWMGGVHLLAGKKLWEILLGVFA